MAASPRAGLPTTLQREFLFMTRFSRIAATLALLLATAKGALASDLMIMNQAAPASLTAQAGSGAIYLSIMNHGAAADQLVAVATPAAQSAMLHEMKMEGDVMTMRALPALDIPAGATVDLKPGGTHIMLMGLKAPLKAGDTLALDLTFAKGGVVKVEVPVTAKP